MRRRLAPFARPYRRWLVVAVMASLLVTAAQLALPLPLAWLVDLASTEQVGTATPIGLPSIGSPMAAPALTLVGVGLVLGLAEHVQRLAVSRFVVRSVNDARIGILTSALEAPSRKTRVAGDVVTRVVGDSARLRVGLKGALVHLLQHGLFLLGTSIVLIALDVWLGVAYLGGLTVALAVAVVGSRRAALLAQRRRERESRVVEEALRAATTSGPQLTAKRVDRERPVAIITQIKGRTAWAVQGVLAVAACLVLTLAVHFADSGRLDTGDVALVSSYLLMLHYPTMRIGRQVTRLGPQLSSAERLARLAEPTDAHRAEDAR